MTPRTGSFNAPGAHGFHGVVYSDVLADATAREMTGRGPGAELVTLPGIGHAPLLMDTGQIEIVRAWLLR